MSDLTTRDQLEHFAAVKQFYQERGVAKTDADIAKTIRKFDSPTWVNPTNGQEETTGGYDNMWVILRNKYPPTGTTTAMSTAQPMHIAQSSRQIATHHAIGQVSPTRSVQVGQVSPRNASPVMQSVMPMPTHSVQAHAPVQTHGGVVHQAVSMGASAPVQQYSPPVQQYSPRSTVMEYQPYPVPQQIIQPTYPTMGSQRGMVGSLRQENPLTEQTTTMTSTKKERSRSPETLRRAREKAASQNMRSDLKGVGHHSEDNINSTVRQLALNDQSAPRGHVHADPASTSKSSKPGSKYYKLVASSGNKGPGGHTIQSSTTFKAHHLAENEAMGLTSLGASKRQAAASAAGGPTMSASQRAQLGGVRIPTGPSIIRSELAKEDGVLNEFRPLDDHRWKERDATNTFKSGDWLGRGR